MNPQSQSELDAAEPAAEVNGGVPLPSLGEQMIAARERWNLSAGDVARQLRLGLRQVEAMEANHFEKLPGNTFVRGFIRNYAKVVQVDPAAFLDAYERSRPQIAAPEIVATNEHIDFTRKPIPKWVWYSAGIAVLALLAPLVIYLALHEEEPASVAQGQPKSGSVAPATQPSSPAVDQVQVPLALPPAQVVSLGDAVPAPTQDGTASQVLMPPAAPAPTPSGPTLKLFFDGDAWVQIRDKSGKKIFSQLSRAGSEQMVQGTPPLSLIVGDAAKVRITYNDKPVDLTPHIKKTVARLTLE